MNEGLVDLLFCNEDEAAELIGETRAPDAFAREDAGRAMEWMLRYVRVATVSLGARGCVSIDRDGSRGVSPGVRCNVVDTTGAGDSFTAAFLWAYLRAGVCRRAARAGARWEPRWFRCSGRSSRRRGGGSCEGTWRRCCAWIGNVMRFTVNSNGRMPEK